MIKFIIAQGIGFTPGSVKYMPTLGFTIGAAADAADHTGGYFAASWFCHVVPNISGNM